MKGIGASSRLFELLDRQPKIPAESRSNCFNHGIDVVDHLANKLYVIAGITLSDIRKPIRFENIKFTYPARPQSPIFSNMSLTVNPGTVIAVVGASGSGKSTIGSLLLRYYDPNEGDIFIGDHSIKDINTRWWREQVGLVSQEPVLFAGTIADNIAYGIEDATPEQIKEAAIKANCASFIEKFHEGYDTFVGERGISLSGGQKQR
jgi:ABC-type multidrug transport system fused ATPase/permease subunit